MLCLPLVPPLPALPLQPPSAALPPVAPSSLGLCMPAGLPVAGHLAHATLLLSHRSPAIAT
eukprot:13375771-Alexandrium_andersonii.AAC.1